MGVVYLEKKINIDQLEDPIIQTPAPTIASGDLHNIINGVPRTDYEVVSPSPDEPSTSEHTVLTQNEVAKKVSLKQLVDTVLWYHDKQQLNHNKILDVIGNKPYGVPLLDQQGKIVDTALPYQAQNASVILHGPSVPTGLTGQTNNYYIDERGGTIWAWENSQWVLVANLIGLPGKDGLIGPQGPLGPPGNTGSAGANGSVIISGSGVPNVGIGVDGDYYLNKLTFLFYGPKTGTDWGTPILIKGDQGNKGDIGDAGPQGSIGSQGLDGKTILNSNGIPSNSIGNDGDFCIDINNYILYGPKNITWSTGTSIKSNIYVQTTEPVNPIDGTIWINTANL